MIDRMKAKVRALDEAEAKAAAERRQIRLTSLLAAGLAVILAMQCVNPLPIHLPRWSVFFTELPVLAAWFRGSPKDDARGRVIVMPAVWSVVCYAASDFRVGWVFYAGLFFMHAIVAFVHK